MDPSQWWDHRSEKVTEHKSCQSSYVNGAIALVGVNVVALSRLKVGAALGFKFILIAFMFGMWRIHG